MTLYKKWLNQLREGTYTITVELDGYDDERILLTVEDSSPYYEDEIEVDWNDWGYGDVWIDLPIDSLRDIDRIKVYDEYGDYLNDLDEDDVEYDDDLRILEETIEYYMYDASDDYNAYITFEIKMDNGDLCTLTVYDDTW